MLYLVPTPIGNLEDITFRAISTLKMCDYILCEDTRHSQILLSHYEIRKPLKSYHEFNETAREAEIIEDLKQGKNIVLISDAGTPAISDPGADLVKACVQAGLEVQAIPGPCAAVTALSCAGFDTTLFQFYGFLPRKQGELKTALLHILLYQGTTLCYESPQRLVNVLETLRELAPNRPLCVARELTKKFEEYRRGTADELVAHWSKEAPRGEIVLVIAGDTQKLESEWSKLSPLEHVSWLEKTYGLSRQEGIKLAAEQRGVPKRDIYNTLLDRE